MLRKEKQAEELYDGIVREMSRFQVKKQQSTEYTKKVKLPSWL
jgi:hypothetical protein